MSVNKTRLSMYPNFWEICKLIANVLRVAKKPNPWDKHKTYVQYGYLPIKGEELCFLGVLREVLSKAQAQENLPQSRADGEPYYDLAETFVNNYVELLKIPCGNSDTARESSINAVVNFLGEDFRTKSSAKFDILLGSVKFNGERLKELKEKNIRSWDDEDKILAFSIPFAGLGEEEHREIYDQLLGLILRKPDSLSNNGLIRGSIWTDQFTTMGASFGWRNTPKIDSIHKQIYKGTPVDIKAEITKKLETVHLLSQPDLETFVKTLFPDEIAPQMKPVLLPILVKGFPFLLQSIVQNAIQQTTGDPETVIEELPQKFMEVLKILDGESTEEQQKIANAFAEGLCIGATGNGFLQMIKPLLSEMIQRASDPQMQEFIRALCRMVFDMKKINA